MCVCVCVCFHRRPLQPVSKRPSDWKRPPGRPNHTWLRAVESDLRPLKIGPSYVWKKAASREHWRSTVECGHSDTHEEYAVKRQRELTATSSTERQQSWLEACLLDTCLLCSVMTGVWCVCRTASTSSLWAKPPLARDSEHYTAGCMMVGTPLCRFPVEIMC